MVVTHFDKKVYSDFLQLSTASVEKKPSADRVEESILLGTIRTSQSS